MAFNKNKALESALKFLNQGKVAQAIGEYQQILRHDPKDQATLMTVGDLFARQGDMPQAIEYFERLAQVYLSDGFNSKAIAIYKKIAKLAPAELAPLERLADLYVQQGVLSEARPLFLQIAEAHLKANHAQRAVEVLHRLLEVEPENPRVQMRLAELYNVMGQKKEAAQTYLNYAQRLFDRGDSAEAGKLIERALEVEGDNPAALLLKAKVLAGSSKPENVVPILEKHPEADAGGDVTHQLIDAELKAGNFEKAIDRARKQLARGHAHTELMVKVTDALIESGKPADALPLLEELRDPMIEAGEQDKFVKSLTAVTERMPGKTAPLEMLVDFCRHTSDPFRLSDAISKLADSYAALGNFARAEELLQELIDRNKDDERLVERLKKLQAQAKGTEPAAETEVKPKPAAPEPVAQPMAIAEREAAGEEGEATTLAAPEEPLDEETQRYIAQALTDVDLFSSYGLTQKATHLLESVLERAPRHTPTLERLLDLYLGAGNERRTAEMAAQLEQIHRERGDTVNTERFAELRQRFQKVAGISEAELPPAPPATASPAQPPVSAEAAVAERAASPQATPKPGAPPAPAEFEIAVLPAEPEPVQDAPAPTPAPVAATTQPEAALEEVDLSDEWEAMVKDVEAPAPAVPAEPEPEPAPVAQAPEPETEVIEIDVPPEPVEDVQAAATQKEEAEPALAEIHNLAEKTVKEASSEPAIEFVEEAEEDTPAAEEVAAGNGEFELELAPEPVESGARKGPATTDDFLSELAAEVDDMQVPGVQPAPVARETRIPVPEVVAAAPQAPAAMAVAPPEPVGVAPAPTAESLNELSEVFQEFRNELGELGEEDEDLETHYNLGIAYREMGLLDEAIGEFQKVAKAVQNGKPFAYAMNCSTLLALSFLDKGEPKIASLWYKRALETPKLEPETVLALRYDLGLALEMAGESNAALDSFRQVYAMNIDYRDVADHIAALQKH
jgi:pilus assembly protein FimV